LENIPLYDKTWVDFFGHFDNNPVLVGQRGS